MQNLGALGGDDSVGYAINDVGQATAQAQTAPGGGREHAFIRELLARLGDAPIDRGQARAQLREMLGDIRMRPDENGGPTGQIGPSEAPLAALARGVQTGVVARSRFASEQLT
jgi:hypothetical protein